MPLLTTSAALAVARPAARPADLTMLAANDPGSTRLVYAMVAGLVLVGAALIVLGVWLVRQTRYDPPVLAPLERMGDSSWRKRDPATQRRILDELRPEGAEPMATGTKPPERDAEFEDARRPVSPLDDLGPGVASSPGDAPGPEPAAPVEEPVEPESVEEPVEPESVEPESLEPEPVEPEPVEPESVEPVEDPTDVER